MIEHRCLDGRTDVMWAVPTSGFGHLADEQPLPFIYRDGVGLTPQCGGDAALVDCGPTRVGLPYGLLRGNWPLAQRVFNLPRRSLNLYWRNAFKSRSRRDRLFFFHEQLNFVPTASGFQGECPFIRFERRIWPEKGAVTVTDDLVFLKSIDFEWFAPVILPLFSEWSVNGGALPRVDLEGIPLQSSGFQCSAGGIATLWMERLEQASFAAGQSLRRIYSYRWADE